MLEGASQGRDRSVLLQNKDEFCFGFFGCTVIVSIKPLPTVTSTTTFLPGMFQLINRYILTSCAPNPFFIEPVNP